ncbi:Cys-Gln thioester bond-forming surface protein [Brevibacterium oceani]|uniref:Cys-Gln thioester bond-forming surface protein n=1 Tax=Brevibacterium oceani TaxID=358099 RepID=UPI001B34038E|nr:Cys-Gln thioester bond-forming surface protein [Brevibacterium oceani]
MTAFLVAIMATFAMATSPVNAAGGTPDKVGDKAEVNGLYLTGGYRWTFIDPGLGGNGVSGLAQIGPADNTNGPYGPGVYAYCIELTKGSAEEGNKGIVSTWSMYHEDGEQTKPSVENLEHINWIVHNSFPKVALAELAQNAGANGLSNVEAAQATQLAIWHYSDGAVPESFKGNSKIEAVYKYLTGDANIGLSEADSDDKDLTGKVFDAAEDQSQVIVDTRDHPKEPSVRTSADFAKEYSEVIGGAEVIDTVDYSDLVKGKTYTLSAELINKADNKVIGSGSKTFTAEAADGRVDVEITVDDSVTSSVDSAVAFETLTSSEVNAAGEDSTKGADTPDDPSDDNLIGEHKDINDEAQTVTTDDESSDDTEASSKDDADADKAAGADKATEASSNDDADADKSAEAKSNDDADADKSTKADADESAKADSNDDADADKAEKADSNDDADGCGVDDAKASTNANAEAGSDKDAAASTDADANGCEDANKQADSKDDADADKAAGADKSAEANSNDDADADKSTKADADESAKASSNDDADADKAEKADSNDDADGCGVDDAKASTNANAEAGSDKDAAASTDADANGCEDANKQADSKDDADADKAAGADKATEASSNDDADADKSAEANSNDDADADKSANADSNDDADGCGVDDAKASTNANAEAGSDKDAATSTDADANGCEDANKQADSTDDADADKASGAASNETAKADSNGAADAGNSGAHQGTANANGSASSNGGDLPRTGADGIAAAVALSLMLLAAGTATVVIARWKRMNI